MKTAWKVTISERAGEVYWDLLCNVKYNRQAGKMEIVSVEWAWSEVTGRISQNAWEDYVDDDKEIAWVLSGAEDAAWALKEAQDDKHVDDLSASLSDDSPGSANDSTDEE